MTKTISTAQAVSILTISQLFSVLLFSPLGYSVSDASYLVYGSMVGVLIQVILLLPMWMFFRTGQEDVFLLCRQGGAWLKGFGVLMLLLLLGGLFQTAVRFQFFITVAVFSDASTAVVLLALMVAVVYGASMGLEGIVRAGSIIAVVGLFLMVLSQGTLLEEIDWINLRPIDQNGTFAILQIGWEQATNNTTLLLLVLLAPKVKGSFQKMAGLYLLLAGGLSVLLYLFCVLVLGDYLATQSFPYYSMASIASTDIFQRLDALQMSLIVLVAYLKMAIFFLFFAKYLQRFLPKSWHAVGFWGSAGLVFLGSLGLSWWVARYKVYNQMAGTDVAMLLVLVVLPVLLLWKGGCHEKSGKSCGVS